MSDDLIRRGDAAKICDDEAAKFASKADAAAASVAAGETTNEPFFVACMLATIRLRAAAEEIRALPAVAREPEAHVCSTGKRGACLHPSHWPAPSQPTCLRCGRKAHGAMEVCPAPTTMDPAPRPNLDAVVDLVRRAESPSPPTCARCGGLGAVVERCLSRDCAGHFITCPACAGGRRA